MSGSLHRHKHKPHRIKSSHTHNTFHPCACQPSANKQEKALAQLELAPTIESHCNNPFGEKPMPGFRRPGMPHLGEQLFSGSETSQASICWCHKAEAACQTSPGCDQTTLCVFFARTPFSLPRKHGPNPTSDEVRKQTPAKTRIQNQLCNVTSGQDPQRRGEAHLKGATANPQPSTRMFSFF